MSSIMKRVDGPSDNDIACSMRRGLGGGIVYWHDCWCFWNGRSYEPVSGTFLEHLVHQYLRDTDDASHASLARVRRIVGQLRLVSLVHGKTPPCWLCDETLANPRNLLVLKNGLLEIAMSPRLITHSPGFFGFRSTDYDYRKSARCPTWREFLGTIWGRDRKSQRLLQEWFGYCLLPDTSQQKILGIYGPPCSGKSTIARVLRELLGRGNVACPSIRSLSGEFGLWALHDKLVAILPDATLLRPCPAAEERLKLVSGEDAVDIQRKGMTGLSGERLPTRFVIIANEAPAFLDPSGALARRLIVLWTQKSFVGREDIRLTNRLLEELPGILNWALEGWKRLQERGRFEDTVVSAEAAAILSSLPDQKRIRRVVVEYDD
jgi:putative DNA primase/helicase